MGWEVGQLLSWAHGSHRQLPLPTHHLSNCLPPSLQPFNSPEEGIAELSMAQVRAGIVREMMLFNPDIQHAQLR